MLVAFENFIKKVDKIGHKFQKLIRILKRIRFSPVHLFVIIFYLLLTANPVFQALF